MGLELITMNSPCFILLSMFFLLFSPFSLSYEKDTNRIDEIISDFRTGNIESISKQVHYPLNRPHPLKSIGDKNEFQERFFEIFDDTFLKDIIESNSNSDWSAVGWRGISMHSGNIWLNYDGQISAINYKSPATKVLIEQQKNASILWLHSSVKEFDRNIINSSTKDYYIRIDRQADNSMRYAAWENNKSTLEEPSLVLKEGKKIYEGSGGNHKYVFINEDYKYIFYVTVLGKVNDMYLEVYKSNTRILRQRVE